MDTFQYSARAGDVISFRLLRVASGGPLDTSTGFYVAVYGPDNTVINAVNTNRLPLYPVSGRTDVTATANGPLTVVIWEATANKGGAYYVSGVRLNGGCGGPALTCSSALEGQLTTPLSFASYIVNATVGDVYQLRVGRADTAGTFAVAPRSLRFRRRPHRHHSPGNTSGHAAASGTVRFAQGGAYSVLVSGSTDGSAGYFTIASTRISRPVPTPTSPAPPSSTIRSPASCVTVSTPSPPVPAIPSCFACCSPIPAAFSSRAWTSWTRPATSCSSSPARILRASTSPRPPTALTRCWSRTPTIMRKPAATLSA